MKCCWNTEVGDVNSVITELERLDYYIEEVVFTVSVAVLFGQHLLSICFHICEHGPLLYILVHKESRYEIDIYVTK